MLQLQAEPSEYLRNKVHHHISIELVLMIIVGDLNSLGRLMLRIKYEVQGNLTAKIIKELMSQVDSNWKTVLESLLESSSSDPDIYDKIMEIVAKIE
jgi:hypothetical protein